MSGLADGPKPRILVIDDNSAIHEDFAKILCPTSMSSEIDAAEAALFGQAAPLVDTVQFELDTALQGAEGLKKVEQSIQSECPYALAFVDMRMPPGWDGVETVERLWKADPELHTVICTAYSDYSWTQIVERLGQSHRLLILKKPFDPVEVQQLALAMYEKQRLASSLRQREAQLRHSQKLEAVGQLAGGVAHEFNNILQAIKGYCEFAMDGLEDSDQRFQDLREIARSTDRAALLTRQLLGFSRQQPLNRQEVAPNELVGELSHLLQPTIGEHIQLNLALGEVVSNILTDPALMQQVLLNLCVNARDAMPDGGTLTISTSMVTFNEDHAQFHPNIRTGTYVRFTVTDTGHGMDSEVQRHAFEPFYTTKEVGKGSGLGLAMVYGIVEQHDGTIHLYSEPGLGTTVKVYLPAARVELNGSQPPSNPVMTGSETILVAEDDPSVQAVTVRILRRGGYTVLTASDGAEAVRMFQQHVDQIDMAVLDVVMPKMTGRAVLTEIRKIRPDLPVVFCSGYDPELNCSAFTGEQEFPLLQKPVDPRELLKTIRNILEQPQPAGRELTATT